MKILFVCNMGKYRSKTASVVWKELYPKDEVDYIGIFIEDNPKKKFDWADKIYVMEDQQLDEITKIDERLKTLNKTIMLNIEDKYNYMDKDLINILEKKFGIDEFYKFSKKNSEEIVDKIFSNVIFGHNSIKKLVVLQSLSSKPFHILIIGDRKTGKSKFVQIPKILNIKTIDDVTSEILDGEDFTKSIFATKTPVNGRLDLFGDLIDEVDLRPLILSKFHIVCILRDIVDKRRDELIANSIIDDFYNLTKKNDIEFYINYINYAKKIKPVISEKIKSYIKEIYIKYRSLNSEKNELEHSLVWTTYQLETLLLLIESYAKLELSKEVKRSHVDKALEILMYNLEKIAINTITCEIDIDRLMIGKKFRSN